jgi:hypothetical protein
MHLRGHTVLLQNVAVFALVAASNTVFVLWKLTLHRPSQPSTGQERRKFHQEKKE